MGNQGEDGWLDRQSTLEWNEIKNHSNLIGDESSIDAKNLATD